MQYRANISAVPEQPAVEQRSVVHLRVGIGGARGERQPQRAPALGRALEKQLGARGQ
jgi:hypothetical protein